MSASFFIGGQYTVAIGIEKSEHGVVGPPPASVLKNTDVGPAGNGLPDALCELNRPVMRAIVTDKTAHETDDNIGRRSAGIVAKHGGVDGLRDTGGGGG